MFAIKKDAEIRAVNISKGNNDESPVCVTIGMKFEGITAEPVAASLGCEVKELDAWFRENGEQRYNGIVSISTWADYEDQHNVKIVGHVCPVRKISAIKIRPYGGKLFEVNCNVQIQDPPSHVIEKIAVALHTTKPVELTPQAELPLKTPDIVHETGTK